MRFRLVQELAADFDVAVACRLLGVSRSGYYEWLTRAPSSREVADSALTDVIERVHAELRLGLGVRVGRKRVARLMRSAGIVGVSHRRKRRGWKPDTATHEDLVKRQFRADRPDRVWFCDITQHREGRVGLLRGGARCLLATHRRMVDLGSRHVRDRRRRARDGPLATSTGARNRGSRGPGRSTRPGSSATGSGRPGSSDRWDASRRVSTTRSSSRSGRQCSASFSTVATGCLAPSSRRRCSSGSKGFTIPDAVTPRSAASAPPTTKHYTRPPTWRHDQHKERVRETGSGSGQAPCSHGGSWAGGR